MYTDATLSVKHGAWTEIVNVNSSDNLVGMTDNIVQTVLSCVNIRAAPCENVLSSHPRTAKALIRLRIRASAQSDLGLRCPLTELLNAVEYSDIIGQTLNQLCDFVG